MSNGLESTIKDIVKQALTGALKPGESSNPTTEAAKEPSPEADAPPTVNGSEPMETQTEEPIRDENKSVAEDTHIRSATPVKQQETVTKNEPLTDSQNQVENKLTPENLTATDPVATNEMIEKLQWKHKCEIEAIKHNAGKFLPAVW